MLQMSMTVTPEHMPLGILGQIAKNCWQFRRSDFSPDVLVMSTATGREAPPAECFRRQRRHWVVRNEGLPYEANVKGISIDGTSGRLNVELSEIDVDLLNQAVERDLNLRGKVTATKARILWQGAAVFTVRSRTFGKGSERSHRCLVRTCVDLASIVDITPLAQILDLIYNANCFREDALPTIEPATINVGEVQAAGPVDGKPGMRQEQRMVMLITREQQMRMTQGVLPQMVLAQRILQMKTMDLHVICAELGMDIPSLDRLVGKHLWVLSVRRIQEAARNAGKPITFDQAVKIRRKVARK